MALEWAIDGLLLIGWDRPAPAALGTDADDLDVLVAAILNAFVDRNEPFFESSRKAANVSSMGARSSD